MRFALPSSPLVDRRAGEAQGTAALRASFNHQPLMIVGATMGALLGFCFARFSMNPMLALMAALMLTMALARLLVLALTAGCPSGRAGNSGWQYAARCTDWGVSLTAGLAAGTAIWWRIGGAVETLLVAHAIYYTATVVARDNGQPALAVTQAGVSLAPIIMAAAAVPELPYRLLALVVASAVPAMATMRLNVSRIVDDSLTAARTSAQLASKMQLLARSDPLTGLANRAGLNHHLRELSAALAPGECLALFWLDLDRFKEVNDTLGHPVGDAVLSTIGQRLTALAPPGACLGRFGGDEFVVALEGLNRDRAAIVAADLIGALAAPISVGLHRIDVGSSIGIAMLPEDGADVETVMQAADLALYHAKLGGRGRFCFFEHDMTRRLVRRREIEGELRRALLNDELSVFFQPIVELASGRITGFEALVRWFHPEKGELLPDEFIPVAEETGAIITLGNWIAAEAARVAAGWPDDITIAVNLSPLQIRAPGAAMAMLAALRKARLAPTRLELEITERVLLDDSPSTEAFIAELAQAGVRFALDDFGTGYSSLAYLDKYPFTRIKIDRSFVSGINAGRKSDAIIRAVSTLGATLGMEIVAEGLETAEQAIAVREAGCTYGQGWYYSRAAPDYIADSMVARQIAADAAALARQG